MKKILTTVLVASKFIAVAVLVFIGLICLGIAFACDTAIHWLSVED